MTLLEKIITIVCVLWFIVSVIIGVITPFYSTNNDVVVLVMLNLGMSSACAISCACEED